MSNAMSRSKASWKAAMLATAASAAMASLAHAQVGTMSLSLSLSPMGSSGPKSVEYIAPTGTVPIYVYATVTSVNAGTVEGLQYAYFNVNETLATGGVSLGSIIAATPNAALGFGANGSQGGLTAAATAIGSNLVVGSNTDITQVAKPRSANGLYSTNTGSGIIVNGNSVSFLLETLTYQPAFTPKKAVAGSADVVSFSLAAPSTNIAGGTTVYPTTNYFTDLGAQPGVGTPPGAANTGTSYTIAGSGVSLIDGEQGDVNLDGIVNGTDLNIIASHYNQHVTGYTNGDVSGDNIVNGTDLNAVATNFNVRYSTVVPALAGGNVGGSVSFGGELASATAQVAAVPEPTSLGVVLLAGAGMLRRRRARA